MTNSLNRLIFMGTPDFAVPCLQALIDKNYTVTTVITQPDRPSGRGRKLMAPPVKLLADAHKISVLQPSKIRSEEFLDEIRKLAPDLIIVVAYGRILPGSLLDLPTLGTINVHGSLLPKYRGAAPIQRAILSGDRETGITIMQLDEGMDTGDILLPGSLAIDPDDTSGTLAKRMADLGGKLLIEALERLQAGNLPPRQQDEALKTMAPPLCKHEALIDWTQPAEKISCQIRGLDPWPLAYTTLDGTWLRLFRPEIITKTVIETPGTLCAADKHGLVIATGENYLLVKEVQRQGGKRLAVASFICGHPLTPGLVFS